CSSKTMPLHSNSLNNERNGLLTGCQVVCTINKNYCRRRKSGFPARTAEWALREKKRDAVIQEAPFPGGGKQI
ncbi:MAG: hypothetical protein SPL71_04915, partial [Oribacterium sp.]|nr:hypothetical protein [Oribacterium sp.]